MSIQLINHYYTEVDRLIQFGGKANEAVISQKFGDLIDGYCRKRHLLLVPQVDIKTREGRLIRPDGTIKNVLRLDYGYWESKANVDLEDEIRKKFNAGYPRTNILFEDSKTAILYQQGQEAGRASIRDAKELDLLLTAFVGYEHPEVKSFNEAVQRFKHDIPTVLETLRLMIEAQGESNARFIANRKEFLALCKQSINPDITEADVNEMLIQHILTEEIFVSIFSDAQFHRENNIARELYKVEETFFTGQTKHQTLDSIKDYYEMIKAQATGIVSYHEKQTFLKVIYENFYKAYNPKGADRLGIVYTPTEIVTFMIEGVDYLLHKQFGTTLGEKNVEILDPATGTGTFICDIIDYLPTEQVVHKYRNELHANEVAILPYYIANLNIEYIFKQKTGYYEEFPHICFVDTLDNVEGLQHSGHELGLFGFSAENAERIRKQNRRKISVIIGNPPYNANQQNENDNNKNRVYPQIDKRIKATYIAASTAQKTKLYDMYSRFFRWATDRLDKNGIIAFISNRSFIDSRTFDGFRKCIQEEFDHALIVDTRSDVRANPKISGTGHNVFGIQTGVAVMFLLRKEGTEKRNCTIDYFTLQDEQLKEEKLDWFRNTRLRNIDFQRIYPDSKNNWINQADNDFESLLPLVDKEVKAGKSGEALFQLFSLGVVTARDEWVYDEDESRLNNKVNHLIGAYNADVAKHSGKTRIKAKSEIDYTIKWSRAVINDLVKGKKYTFDKSLIVDTLYRPYNRRKLYFSNKLNEMQYQAPMIFGDYGCQPNKVIIFTDSSSQKPFMVCCSAVICDYHFVGAAAAAQCLPLYRYDKDGARHDNITDWGVAQFREFYGRGDANGSPLPESTPKGGRPVGIAPTDQTNADITREDIFHYVYAVLHNPAYRTKYELNLKREFPRIPFYDDFHQWAAWGQALMELHLNYETVEPYPLQRIESGFTAPSSVQELPLTYAPRPKKGQQELLPTSVNDHQTTYTKVPKAKLKADKEAGRIILDEQTTLAGVPSIAWDYKLGNRSALEWVLDQYKEKKPSDPTIAEKFNTYRFADYKEKVIDLLMRVCTVSVRTMEIVVLMSGGGRR